MADQEEQPKQTYAERLVAYIQEHKDEELTEDLLFRVTALITDFAKANADKNRADHSKMPFGKFKGKSLKSIAAFDKPYLRWLSKQEMMDNFPELSQNIRTLLK